MSDSPDEKIGFLALFIGQALAACVEEGEGPAARLSAVINGFAENHATTPSRRTLIAQIRRGAETMLVARQRDSES